MLDSDYNVRIFIKEFLIKTLNPICISHMKQIIFYDNRIQNYTA